MPGRSTFTATARAPVGVAISARCTCAIEAAATGGPNDAKDVGERLARSAAATVRLGLGLRERRHLVLQAFEIARERDADHVRPRRQELAELDVGRPEPRSAPPPAGCGVVAGRPLDQPRAGAAPARAGSGSGVGSSSAEHALAGEHEAGAARAGREMGERRRSQAPARMQRHDAAGQRLER